MDRLVNLACLEGQQWEDLVTYLGSVLVDKLGSGQRVDRLPQSQGDARGLIEWRILVLRHGGDGGDRTSPSSTAGGRSGLAIPKVA